jgi:photosystem II stability/assembly factor-like uncharacterized protein
MGAMRLVLFAASLLLISLAAHAQTPPAKPAPPDVFGALRLRALGPAVTSGRVNAFAVEPGNRARYYLAAASGGVWKTVNAGTTWAPIFDDQGSYSIGAIVLDPKNPNTVWVGTGECNSQRSVGYGDGVYRSDDGGKTWTNVGLKTSEHIGRIALDPRDARTVYVAAQGPLWSAGGERGLYKTTDNGTTWKCVLAVDENTGATEIAIDPENPDTLYAATYQRRRHVWTLIDGGPGSALYKSTDAGATWTRLRTGLPGVDMGRIGIAISPVDPRVLYATIEAASGAGGIFRSTDAGASWERRNDFDQTAMYYGQIVADPKNVDRIYVPNTLMQTSDDGGRTLRPLGERSKHVDNHAIWIDPQNTDYCLVGCDGGVYESFDRGANWHFKANLPITQFYDVTVDDARPFYTIYGGTQDNATLGGPVRTRSASGVTNADWFVVVGGDGFHVRVDPEDNETVYGESQNGGLVRFDRRTGERVDIQPVEAPGDAPLRWNWDTPFLVSSHAHRRLYIGAQRIFRSDDRGDSWTPISADLTRQLDRNQLPVMGAPPSEDAVARHASTAFTGNTSALTESPRQEGLLYAGTDDGVIAVTEDAGKTWRRALRFPGVPERTSVARIVASQHSADGVYAAFDNHQMGDFAPYLLRSADRGRTWTSIVGDLPGRGTVYALAEDPVDPNLLFCGTEFGLFVTRDGGKGWTRLRGGLPTIAVRDLAIQKRHDDLVVATFGRGFYVLEDYRPLRQLTPLVRAQESAVLPVRDVPWTVSTSPLGGGGKASQGESFFTVENPPLGATFTIYLQHSLQTARERRREATKKEGRIPPPSLETLMEEALADPPAVLIDVMDASDRVVRQLPVPTAAGTHRVLWDLRSVQGQLVPPGPYRVRLSRRIDGATTVLPGEQRFTLVPQNATPLTATEQKTRAAFLMQLAALQKAFQGTLGAAESLDDRLGQIVRAIEGTPDAPGALRQRARALRLKNAALLVALRGNPLASERNGPTPTSLRERLNNIVFGLYGTGAPNGAHRSAYAIVSRALTEQVGRLRTLLTIDLPALEKALDAAGIPWTPGRLPDWKER